MWFFYSPVEVYWDEENLQHSRIVDGVLEEARDIFDVHVYDKFFDIPKIGGKDLGGADTNFYRQIYLYLKSTTPFENCIDV